jgi:enhancing lycopene biosynthesis protein 2
MKKIAVLLSGCGVYDGSEIHEAVATLLAIDRAGHRYMCIAPDIEQLHVINHVTGEVTDEKRNVLIESARIARGEIQKLDAVTVADFDALILPGGFGAAKNWTTWAIDGPDGKINPQVKQLIVDCITAKKPIGALCMSPTTIAKALENTGIQVNLTVGSVHASSPYDIAAISQGMEKLGSKTVNQLANEITIDQHNKIVTSPCYMMKATIKEIFEGAEKVVTQVLAFCN